MRRIGLCFLLATLCLSVLGLSACSQSSAAPASTAPASTSVASSQSDTEAQTTEPTSSTLSTESVPETTTTTRPPETTVPTTWQPLADGARVLLIGDSISLGYTTGLQQALPTMEIVHHDGNARSTDFALTSNRLYSWLGDQPWDVIHFNFGLHDLSHVDSQGNEAATDAGDSAPKVSLEQYEANLEQILAILKETDARLIWASTTPVYETAGSRVVASELAYNEVAMTVMNRNGIQVNDLHNFAADNLTELRLGGGDNVHYSAAGYEIMSKAIAEILLGTPTQ